MKIRGGRAEHLFPQILERVGFQIVDSPLVPASGNAVARASSFQDHSLKVDFWIYYDVRDGYLWIPVQLTAFGKKPGSKPTYKHGGRLDKKRRDCKKRGVLLIAINYPSCIQAGIGEHDAVEVISLTVKHAIEQDFKMLKNPLTPAQAFEIEENERKGGNFTAHIKS